MLFDNEGTLTNKHEKYGDLSRIPNIKISSHENKPEPTLAHMSKRVKRDSDRQKSAQSTVSLNSANLPDSGSLTSNSHSSAKMLPRRRRSLRRSGVLIPCDDESKSAEKIKPRRPLTFITRPASENRRTSLFDSLITNSMASPQSESPLRISTEKRYAETTEKLKGRAESADWSSEHSKATSLSPEILRSRRHSKTEYAKLLSPSHKKQLCADKKMSYSFSPKHRDARISLMRKFLDTKDGCFGGGVWKQIQQAFEPSMKRDNLSLQEFMQILEDIEFFRSDGLIDVVVKTFNYSSTDSLNHHIFLDVLSSIYTMAHPNSKDNSVTVVLLQDEASGATDISEKLAKAVTRLRQEHESQVIRLMRVQHVRELDVREQFWRLDQPVNVTFMFYDPSSPDQANARKLKSAFPKMKICLCGNDSNIGDMVKNSGDLPPSRWKFPDAMADDFLFEPFLDIEVPLASMLNFQSKSLSSGSNHLQWAKQNLLSVATNNTDDDCKVRVSSHSIADMQQDFISRMRDGKIMTQRDARTVPYVYQGDSQMYTTENLKKRKRLLFHPEIGKAIRAFWNVLDLTKDSCGCIRMSDYMVMNIKIQKALMPGLRINDAIPSAAKDWQNDCEGDFMTEDEFFESFFEMTDLWCSTVDHHEYVFFLVSLLNAITVVHGSVDGCLRWRCDQDINHVNYKRAIKQLREASSKSSIAVPKSNTRTKWKKGAKVETEGASGAWYWAKIVACNDDGTFNVHVFDETGCQEWDHVRPVHLRSRCQRERPEGTANRPVENIPRWDGDDGTAFIEGMANNKMTTPTSVTNLTNLTNRPGGALFKKSPLPRTTKKKASGFWEGGDDSDDSASDHDSTVSGLVEDGTKVESTSANTTGNASRHPGKAGSRRSKQKRKPKDSFRRRRKNKNRRNTPRSGAKIAFKKSKDEARPLSSEEGEFNPGEQILHSGIDRMNADADKIRPNSKGTKYLNKSRRPKAVVTSKQTQKHFLGDSKYTQNLSPRGTKQRKKHFLGSPRQAQNLIPRNTKQKKKLSRGNPKQTQNKLSLGNNKNTKKLFMGSTKQTQNTSLSNTKQTQNLSLAGTKQTQNLSLAGTKQTQNLSLAGTKHTQNLSRAGTKHTQNLSRAGTKHTQNLSLAGTKQTQNLSLAGTKQTKKHFLDSTKQTQNLSLAGTKQTQNHSLRKIRHASATVKRMHANVRRSQSDDSVISPMGRKNQKEHSVKISLPSAAVYTSDRPDDPSDDREEAKEHIPPGMNSNGDTPEGKPDALSPLVLKERQPLDKPLTRMHSTSNLYSTSTRSERRQARKAELEKEKMKLTVYHGITKSAILEQPKLSTFSFGQKQLKARPIKKDRMQGWRNKMRAEARRKSKSALHAEAGETKASPRARVRHLQLVLNDN